MMKNPYIFTFESLRRVRELFQRHNGLINEIDKERIPRGVTSKESRLD